MLILIYLSSFIPSPHSAYIHASSLVIFLLFHLTKLTSFPANTSFNAFYSLVFGLGQLTEIKVSWTGSNSWLSNNTIVACILHLHPHFPWDSFFLCPCTFLSLLLNCTWFLPLQICCSMVSWSDGTNHYVFNYYLNTLRPQSNNQVSIYCLWHNLHYSQDVIFLQTTQI